MQKHYKSIFKKPTTNSMLQTIGKDLICEITKYIDNDKTLTRLLATCKEINEYSKDPRFYKHSLESNPECKTLKSLDDINSIELWTDIQEKEYGGNLFLQKGRNLFVTGPGGTGKTHYVNSLCTKSKNYVVQTSTTGSSACLFGGQTIYSALGILIPILVFYDYKTNSVLTPIEAAKKEVSRLRTKHGMNSWFFKSIKNIKVLRIDEISMLSKSTFEYIDYCVRYMRGQLSLPFGGIQLIISGDFRQFSPIQDVIIVNEGKPNEKKVTIPDSEKVALLSTTWKELNLHTVDLKFSYRQSEDPEYTEILNRMRIGQLEPRDIRKLKERIIKKDMKLPEECLMVYSTNKKVLIENKKKLDEINQPLETYNPVFNILDPGLFHQIGGKASELNPYKEALYLKKTCKVMLLRNLIVTKGLVNGRMGIYKGLHTRADHTQALIIRFNGDENDTHIDLVMNTVKATDGTTDLYSYGQYPVTLGYAFSPQKLQGQTASMIAGDCGYTSFGQGIYVTCSRVGKLKNLYLYEFDPSRIEIDKTVDEYFATHNNEQHEVIVDELEFKKRSVVFKEAWDEKLKHSSNNNGKLNVLEKIRTGSSSLAKVLNLNKVSRGSSSSMGNHFYNKLDVLEHGGEMEVIELSQAAKNGIENEPYIINIHKENICKLHFPTYDFKDAILGDISIARPDSIFFENGFYLPLEVKSPDGENYGEIPMDHILQLMFEIMCMDEKNQGRKTPYGDYMSVVMNVETKQIISPETMIAVRVYRDEDMIKMIRNRLMFFYNNYIFKGVSVPSNLFKNWKVPLPKIVDLFTLYEDFDIIIL